MSTYIPEGLYLTKAQVARIEGVALATVQLWIDKGLLPSIQTGDTAHHINEKDLENFRRPKLGRPPRSTPCSSGRGRKE
jgi:hypothetical protein